MKAPSTAPSGGSRRWLPVIGVAAAFLSALFIYAPALSGPFLLDDRYLPFMAAGYESAPLSVWMRGVRPALMLSFWVNYRLSGMDTFSYHLLNVLLHAANGVLLALILRKLLEWAGVERVKGWTLAAFGAAVFLLHPVQTESVAYVASRSETLSIFFFYLALVVFLWRQRTEVTWLRAGVILLLFGLAASTKEHTVVLPVVLVLTDYFWSGFTLRGIRGNWRLYLPVAAGGVLGLVAVARVLGRAESAGFNMKDFTWYQYFFTQCRVIWLYVREFLAPVGLNIDWDMPVSKTLDAEVIVAMLGLAALAVAAWVYRKRYPLAAYGYFLFLILLAPTSSFVPIRDLVAERRMYLPFLGLVLVVLEFLRRWRTSQQSLVGVLSVIALVLAGLSYQRNVLWGSDLGIWADSVTKSPKKYRPRFQLAYALYQAGQCDAAAEQYEMTSKLQQAPYDLFVDWALALDCAHQPQRAVDTMTTGLQVERNAAGYATLGMLQFKNGNRAAAMEALDTAQRIDPNFDMTYAYRGNIYLSGQDYTDAIDEYRRALAINPRNELAADALRKAEAQRATAPPK